MSNVVDKNGNIPPVGENTNSDIGGVYDWQHVGEKVKNVEPPLGPVAKIMQNATFSRGTDNGANIPKPSIDAKSTGGVVGKPQYASYQKSSIKDGSLNYDGGINPGTSGVNLSAKFKTPNINQDIEPVQKQYTD